MYNLDESIKKERTYEKSLNKKNGEMSAREWVNKDWGSASCQTSSFNNIYSAVRDYYDSRQWN